MAKNYGKENDKEFLNNENVKKYIKQGIESDRKGTVSTGTSYRISGL